MKIQDNQTKEVLKIRLIERIFPFRIISELAFREGNAKRFFRPILTLHKWFARRLGTIFRSILIFSAIPIDHDNKRVNISETEFWNLFLQEHDFSNMMVCDPFMGGGTTLVEGIRLGFKMIGGDLNPVAWFTVKKELDHVNTILLEEEYNKLEQKISKRLLKYYQTRCGQCNENNALAMYFFWIREIDCDYCNEKIPLFRSFILTYEKGKSRASITICKYCGCLVKGDLKNQILCSRCGKSYTPNSFNAKRGRYICPKCLFKGKISKSKEMKTKRFSRRMYAIEYYCPNCRNRDFKVPDSSDFKLYNNCEKEYEILKDDLPIPQQKIPCGLKTQELLNHEYYYFKNLFTKRQLLCLGLLLKEILTINDQNLQEFFLLTLSTALEYNNLLCEYHRKNHYIYNLFRKHAFPATLNPVENNVWGTKYGTGTFRNFMSKTIKIKKYCENPYEIKVINGKSSRIKMIRTIAAKNVQSYSELLENSSESKVFLYCGSSNNIPLLTDTIDLIVTDPPYFDNVMYAELSDFYFVWLRIGLSSSYDFFKPDYTPKIPEVIKNIKLEKDDVDYQNRLRDVFLECNRILKQEGLLIFTFHHKQMKAWASLIKSLVESRFYIVNTYPVLSEMKTSTQIRGTKGLEFDIIFICRKIMSQFNEGADGHIEWDILLQKIEDHYLTRLTALTHGNSIEISENDQQILKIGLGLQWMTQYYPNIVKNGKKLQIDEMLSLFEF